MNLNQWLDTKPERIEQLSLSLDQIKAAYNDCTVAMMTLNKNAAMLMNKFGAHGATGRVLFFIWLLNGCLK